jgi:single-strand DNA-binding protein
MEGLNRVVLVGNLCADPELKFSQGGQGVLKLRVACTESWYDKDASERKERTEYVNVIVWGKRGEGLAKILEKGRCVWVEGRLQTRSWEAKEGGKRYATEVVATQVGLTSGGGQRGVGPRSGGQRDSGSNESEGAGEHDDDGSIPF